MAQWGHGQVLGPGPWFYTSLPSLPCLAWLPQALRDPSPRPLTQAGSLFSPRMPGMLAQPLEQARGVGWGETRAALGCTARQRLDSWTAGRGPISSRGKGYPSRSQEAPTRPQADGGFSPLRGHLYIQSVPGQWDNVPFARHRRLRGEGVRALAGVSLNEVGVAAVLTVHPANYERATWLAGPMGNRLTSTPASTVVVSALCPLAANWDKPGEDRKDF